MQQIDPQLDLALSKFICGWHALEQKNGIEIIDMALADKSQAKEYASRNDVLKDIENFLVMDEIKAHSLIHRKMTAHHYFLRKLMGEHIPFQEYFEHTMGTKRIVFSEKKIDALHEQANEVLDAIGLTFNPAIHQQLIEHYKNELPDDKLGLMAAKHQDFYSKIDKQLHLNADFNINYGLLPDDHNYTAWISGDGRIYDVRINQKRMANYLVPEVEVLGIHELSAHAVQWTMMRRKIDKGEWPRYLGYVTVHEPIQFAAEGLAMSLHRFYPEERGQTSAAQIADIVCHRIVYTTASNAYFRFCSGEPYDDCMTYMMQRGGYSEKAARKRLDYIAVNPADGHGYRQIYGQAMETFGEIAGSHPDKNAFIKSVYEGFLMPEDIVSQTRRPVAEFV